MSEAERAPELDDVDPPFSGSAPSGVDAGPEEAGPGLPPPTAVESLVGALLEAGPEVAEHVVRAAQELLLAVQAIVDAADRAVQEQQRLHAEAAARAADAAAGGTAGGTGGDDEPADGTAATDGDGDPAPVRHLDLAE